MLPWKPQCGENQLRRGFIESSGQILQQQNYSHFWKITTTTQKFLTTLISSVLGVVWPSNTSPNSAEIFPAIAALFPSCMALLVRLSGLLNRPEISATKLLCCSALYGLLYSLYNPQKGCCTPQLHPEIFKLYLLPLPSSFSPQFALKMVVLLCICSAAKLSHSLQL
jgi:hypothetical protein